MNTQNTFSFFKDKTPRFDWLFIMLTGAFLLAVSFLSAWYLMDATQESSGDIKVKINNAVILDEEAFQEIEERFTSRKGSLADVLIDIEDKEEGTEIEASDESDASKDLEDA